MDDQKLKRIVVASTVTGVLLAFILIFVLIYQLVSLSALKKRESELDDKIASYSRDIEQLESDAEKYSAYWYIEKVAREKGYVYENDDKF